MVEEVRKGDKDIWLTGGKAWQKHDCMCNCVRVLWLLYFLQSEAKTLFGSQPITHPISFASDSSCIMWWNVNSLLWLVVLYQGPGLLGNGGGSGACRLPLKAERESFVLWACMLIKLRLSSPSGLLRVSWHGVRNKSYPRTPVIGEAGRKKMSKFHVPEAFDFAQPSS